MRVRIYLVRHGDAVSEEDAGSDRDRWLSPRGREAARVLGRLLREQQIAIDAILCSPLPRAVQTAELLAASLDYLGPIASRRCFEPSAHPRIASQELMTAGGAAHFCSAFRRSRRFARRSAARSKTASRRSPRARIWRPCKRSSCSERARQVRRPRFGREVCA
jgi:bisphosphoglycerate-dependent phosphoglycerate mutase